jgi:DNA-binding beta-propeller fold protein YncE
MTRGALLFCAAVTLAAQVRFERAIPLPGVEGRIDHLAVDADGKRLFVAALGNHTVEVIDLTAARVVHSIKGLGEPQGLFYLASKRELFAADGADGTCRIYETAGYRLLETVKLGTDADNIRFDAKKNVVWVGYGEGALAALDAEAGKRIAEVRLAAHPESFQLEQAGTRIFVNVPDAGRITVIDREKRRVVADWPVAEAAANFPMALDEAGHRLFTGCRKPPRALVFDTTAGRQVAAFDICGDTDDLFFDSGRKRLYVSCGEGFLDVIDTDGYKRLERIATVPGARTSLFVPALDRLYVAARRHGNREAEIRVYRLSE